MKKLFAAILALITTTAPAIAEDFVVAPHAWGWNFQQGFTEMGDKIHHFHSYMMVIITSITVLVLALIAYICIRFSKKRNPVPSKTTHNTMLEVIWTVIPILIVVAIIIPSMKLLYYVDHVEKADMTLKVVGYQWYWGYELPDQKVAEFESRLIPTDKLQPGQKKLLEVDEPLVLPVGKTIRVLTTGDPLGVIHAWGIPALSFKRDATPGRINEGWIKIEREGTYYGQCYELCGPDHAFMPIKIVAVSQDKFNEWVVSKGGQVASNTPIDEPVSGNTSSVNAIKNDKEAKVKTDLPTANNKAPSGEDPSSKPVKGQENAGKPEKTQTNKSVPGDR